VKTGISFGAINGEEKHDYVVSQKT